MADNTLPLSPEADLPPPPERPDCCFGGCAQCVLDDYTDALAEWHAQVERLRAASPDRERDGASTRDA